MLGLFVRNGLPALSDARWYVLVVVCASTCQGATTIAPAIPLMKSRRRIAFSKALDCADYRSQRILQQGFAVMKWVLGVRSQGTNNEPLMSALGQKETFCVAVESGAIQSPRRRAIALK